MADKCDKCGKEFGYMEREYKVFSSLVASHLGKATWEFMMCKKCAIESLKYYSDMPLGEETPKGFQ